MSSVEVGINSLPFVPREPPGPGSEFRADSGCGTAARVGWGSRPRLPAPPAMPRRRGRPDATSSCGDGLLLSRGRRNLEPVLGLLDHEVDDFLEASGLAIDGELAVGARAVPQDLMDVVDLRARSELVDHV